MVGKKKETVKKRVSPANVGPIEGKLVSTPDKAVHDTKVPPKETATQKVSKEAFKAEIKAKFADIRDTLVASSATKKQPRQLRWALNSLEAAEDAALRHVQHSV